MSKHTIPAAGGRAASMLAGLVLLGAVLAGSAQAQSYTARAQLELDATGQAFQIGSQRFRVAPSAVATPSGRSAASADAADDAIVVAGYAVTLKPAAASGGRSKRETASATAPVAGGGRYGVAVAEGSGRPVVVTPRLDVYVGDIGAVDRLARDTGGTVTYASALGGNAVIEYASVDAALKAMQRLQGRAGVKEVSPQILQRRIMTR